jgi:hypothetical protein
MEKWQKLAENINDEVDFEEYEKIILDEKKCHHCKKEQINFWNRMRLINVSQNNTFYMFEDRKKESLRIY